MKISDYLTVIQAAKYIGVSPNTIRNWEGNGIVKVYRHPINKYRIYKKSELDELLQSLESSINKSIISKEKDD